jgi:serine/threonine protein kinase
LSQEWLALRDIVMRFEQACRLSDPPAIDDYLPLHNPLRSRVLVELVHIDLEVRLKAGEAIRVENYLARYPELASDRTAILGLIAAEHELRRRGEPALVLDEYLQRFPQYRAELPDQIALPTLAEGRGPGRYLGHELPEIAGYEVLGLLGRGGMGVVYQARHLGLRREVALKMILTGFQAGPTDLARFRAEIEALARLRHPNIVQIYDVGEASGRPFFSMEYVPGGSLAQHLQGQPQPVRPSAQMVLTLSRAVHAAHCNGIIHRDLKPANILLIDEHEESGSAAGDRPPLASRLASLVPKITDFGLAKMVGGDGSTPGARGPTVTGELVGTPSYMAPEQAMVPRQTVGPATDGYALGAILYELLSGRPPFVAGTALATVLQVLHNEPASLGSLQSSIPRDLETICLKCLQKDPTNRYGSALELAEDLNRYLNNEPIQARPISSAEKLWRWVRRHPMAAGLLAAGLLAPIVALSAMSLLSARLVRAGALECAAQQAELLEEANNEYSRIVSRVERAHYPVNKTVPPTPDTVPLSIPATFLHDVGEQLAQNSRTGVQVHQYSDLPYPWRKDGGPRDEFERSALAQLRESRGQTTVHEFTEMNGQRVVRFAQARTMKQSCVDCHNTHPQSPRKDWQVGDVRGVLEIIRPLDKDEARVGEALRLALFISGVVSGILMGGSALTVWATRRRARLIS